MTSSNNELRIVLIGKTGNGKSAVGNSLLHSRSAFHSTQAAASITKTCEVETANCTDINGSQKKLVVVDTPGFFDTDPNKTNEDVQKLIASQIFEMTSPGVHAFLIVLRVDRFSPEEKNTVDFIKKIFGAGAAKYCIVVFTREDQLEEGQTLDEFIRSSNPLRELVQHCGNRKFAINNKLNGQQLNQKTNRLIQMIDDMVRCNNGSYYTNDEYQRIERQRREEKQRKEEEERKKKKAYEDALQEKAKEEEREKLERQYRERQEEDRRKAKKREQEIQDEERRRADRLEEELRNTQRRSSSTRYCPNYNCSDDGDGFLSGVLSRMMLGSQMPPSYGASPMSMTSQPSRSSSSTIRGGGGARFTGEFMSTRGIANNRPIMEGSRGGQFYWNANGNKTYLRK